MLKTDVVVVGGGIAGCAAALAAARRGVEVLLLTKLPDPEESNTRYAQGGIIYTGPGDSPELLAQDILNAGAGTGSRAAAELLAKEGPALVRRLLVEELEVAFDRAPGGFEGFHLTREAAHSVPRILHCKDTTGWEIQQSLTEAVRDEPRVTLLPGTEALRLVLDNGRCTGVQVLQDEAVENILGRVVLATGGLGALYEYTTNPPSATGDGVALALSAGVSVRDLHYVQFHPTALYVPGGERFLISEAVRGEGGVLRSADGEEFIRHPAGSLAPRDVVARETHAMMQRTGSPCAYLDITHRPGWWLKERFPAIYRRCEEAGVDMAREPIPVVPAAHYSCGGVMVDGQGRTSLRGLWAAGEVAGSGLHGANRLASTSLLEGLVWGWRSGEDAAHSASGIWGDDTKTGTAPRIPEPSEVGVQAADRAETVPGSPSPEEKLDLLWHRLRRMMWERAGLERTGEGLMRGLEELRLLEQEVEETGGTDALRLRRALLVARRVVEGALSDTCSRGCHYRPDTQEVRVADLPG